MRILLRNINAVNCVRLVFSAVPANDLLFFMSNAYYDVIGIRCVTLDKFIL